MRIKAVLLGLLGLLFAAVFGFALWYWTALLVLTGAAIAIFKWKRLPEFGRRIAGVLLLAGLVATLFFAGFGDAHYNAGSSTHSRIPGLTFVLGSTPAEYGKANVQPPPDPQAELRLQLQKKIFALRSQRDAAARAVRLMDQATEVVSRHRDTTDVSAVAAAKQEVFQTLASLELSSVEALEARTAKLDALLAVMEARLTATEPLADRDYTDLSLQSTTVSFEPLADAVGKLDDALNALVKGVVEQRLTPAISARGTFDEAAGLPGAESGATENQKGTFTRDLVVALRWKDLRVVELDPSELMLDKEPGALRHELYYSYPPNATLTRVNEGERIRVNAGVTSVVLLRRTVTSLSSKRLASRLRASQFSYFMFDWPSLMPNQRLRATVSLPERDASLEFPIVLKLTDDPRIEAVIVPRNSFFGSSYSFAKGQQMGTQDELLAGEDLRPSYFLTHGPVWVELLPRSWIARNALVQRSKQFLFLENAGIGLVVMFFGVVWAMVVNLWLPKSSA
jgi:hypothetical protein